MGGVHMRVECFWLCWAGKLPWDPAGPDGQLLLTSRCVWAAAWSRQPSAARLSCLPGGACLLSRACVAYLFADSQLRLHLGGAIWLEPSLWAHRLLITRQAS